MGDLKLQAGWEFVERGYFLELQRRLGVRATSPFGATRDAIVRQAQEIRDANAHRLASGQADEHLRLAALALASYRVIGALDGPEAALEMITAAMMVPFRRAARFWLLLRLGVSPLQPGRAFERVAHAFGPRGGEPVGGAFEYETEARDESRVFVKVRRCFFHDFFTDYEVPEVLGVICRLDEPWAEELNDNPERYHVAVERLGTMARGGDSCRLHFTRLVA